MFSEEIILLIDKNLPPANYQEIIHPRARSSEVILKIKLKAI
jgi:hypothetical protein